MTAWFLMGALLSESCMARVILQGNPSSRVTAFVNNPNTLQVTDEDGTWFPNGVVLQPSMLWASGYMAALRIRVKSLSGVFQVRLGAPLEIRKVDDSQISFRSPSVAMGLSSDVLQGLEPGQSVQFRNPTGKEIPTIGDYDLFVSAVMPEGRMQDIIGLYSGQLTLVFEPVARHVDD